MRRRTVLAGLGIAAASPFAAGGAEDERRVGVLMGSADDAEGQRRVAAFREGLGQVGLHDGRSIRLDLRWSASNAERARVFAKELAEVHPVAMLAEGTPVVGALLKETHTTPIVFVNVSDPVGSGFAADLRHPGGTVTGFISNEASLAGKWMQLLKELVPATKRAAFLYNPDAAPYVESFLRSAEAAAQSLDAELVRMPVHSQSEIASSLASFAQGATGGLIVMADIFTTVHQQQIVAVAEQYRLPAIYPFRVFATAGGLLSYGADIPDLFGRAAAYVERILKGEKPGDLPIQAPAKFQFVLNLKTAKSLGLAVPQLLLAQANEVIE
jgi:putative ABC transport system substrate-binding protein